MLGKLYMLLPLAKSPLPAPEKEKLTSYMNGEVQICGHAFRKSESAYVSSETRRHIKDREQLLQEEAKRPRERK